MSEDSEIWKGHKQERQKKRWRNEEQSLKILQDHGVAYETLNAAVSHYRIGDWNFWPTTGKFYNQKKAQGGRGVFNLLKVLRIEKREQFAADHDDMPDGAFFALAEEHGIGIDDWVED